LKFAELSKYFNPILLLGLENIDLDYKIYNRKIVDAALIFY
jgi:hypothetical protein